MPYVRESKKKKHEIAVNRCYWVHPLNLKSPREGQFQIIFYTLQQHLKEFFRFFRMSISSFDKLVSKFT